MILPLTVATLAALAVLLWPGGAVLPRRSSSRRTEAAGRHAGLGHRVLPRRLVRRLRVRRSSRRVGVVEEVQLLDGLAAALEAGLPTEHAVHVALDPDGSSGPSAVPWPELVHAAREGQPLAPAWHRLARRTGSLTAASVARAWTVAAVTGAPVAAAVRSSAHAARERRRLERAVEAATAGARATAAVLGLLPVAGVGLAALLGVGPVGLYAHPFALASAVLGLVLLGIGHLAVRRMVRGVLGGLS